jgi:cytochrome c oxidase assembly factor CtaG
LEFWSLPIPVTVFLVLATFFYARGWLRLRKAFPNLVSIGHIAAFVSGLVSVWIAVGSPLAEFDDELLSVHMVQHILLMAVAPALILLGAPALPLLHGLPKRLVQGVAGPFLRWAPVRRTGRVLTLPIICWLAATITVIGWHVPAVFELGLQSDWWHEVQHASFFAAGLLFWWPVIQPWPSGSRTPRWSVPMYLFLATLPCDALSAFLAFCDRVVYTSYLFAPRPVHISALQDQEWAGVFMWVAVTFIYMVPAAVVAVRSLSPLKSHTQRTPNGSQILSNQGLEAPQVEVM